ncbi:MAG: hypothetical protein QW265_02960 [Candidatus Bathyarchaeia archaeon]
MSSHATQQRNPNIYIYVQLNIILGDKCMSYGMYGRGYGRGLGLGLGPNLSPYCRWFPGMPRGWWANPSYTTQTMTSFSPTAYPPYNFYSSQTTLSPSTPYQQFQPTTVPQQLNYNPLMPFGPNPGMGVGGNIGRGFGMGMRYRRGAGHFSEKDQY